MLFLLMMLQPLYSFVLALADVLSFSCCLFDKVAEIPVSSFHIVLPIIDTKPDDVLEDKPVHKCCCCCCCWNWKGTDSDGDDDDNKRRVCDTDFPRTRTNVPLNHEEDDDDDDYHDDVSGPIVLVLVAVVPMLLEQFVVISTMPVECWDPLLVWP